jgi:hypothetical protein
MGRLSEATEWGQGWEAAGPTGVGLMLQNLHVRAPVSLKVTFIQDFDTGYQ